MTIETNRFTSNSACERCNFKYGWHVCLAPEILALDKTDPAPLEKPKRTIRGEMTQERRDRTSDAAHKRWTAERIKNEKRDENIARDYEIDWMTIKEICVKYKITKETVVRILDEQGVTVRPRGLTRETHILRTNLAQIKKEYLEDKKGLLEIAVKWNVSQRTVGRVLRENGVQIRPAARLPKYTFN